MIVYMRAWNAYSEDIRVTAGELKKVCSVDYLIARAECLHRRQQGGKIENHTGMQERDTFANLQCHAQPMLIRTRAVEIEAFR